MKPEIVTLCEYASETKGRLTIVDTFESITAVKFPWRAYFYAVSKIDLMNTQLGDQSVTISIVGSQKNMPLVFEASSPYGKNDMGKLNIIAGFKGLIFESAGDYYFRVTIGKKIVVNHLFKVIEKGNGQ